MGTNADAAVGTVVTSFSSIDAATDARLASQHPKSNQNNNSSGTVVLADLLLTLSEQARDIAARVPPTSTSRNGTTRNTRGGGSAELQTTPLPMRIPAPSMQSTDEPEAYVPQKKREDESASARTPCSTGEAEAEEAAMAMSNLNRATDAAEALLVLTASPALRSAFASRDDDDHGSRVNDSDVSAGSSSKNKKKKKKNTRGNRNQPNGAGVVLDRDTVESLHFAFVMVSSWLQSSIRRAAAATAATNSPTQQQAVVDEAIVHAIELTVRSADLALPLTAPLYQSLASDVIAPHASPASHPSLQIMEVANLLRVSLFPAFNPPPVSFFHGPCVTLVRRGMVREAVELLDEMDAEFGIGEVEAMTGLEMLSAVAEGMGLVNDDSGNGSGRGGESGGSQASIVFGRSRSGGGAEQGGVSSLAMELDPVDATELVFRLRGPLLRQLDDVSKELRREMDSAAEGAEASAELVDLLESLSRPAADIDNDGDNSTGNNEDDGDNDDVSEEQLLEEYLEAADDPSAADDKASTLADIETLSDAVSSLAEDGSGPSPASAVGRSRGSDASTSTIYSAYQIPQSLHNQMASEMIYVRKGPSWDLPDLVEQLKRFNDGKDILYTRQYEEEMINAMMRDWEGDEDDFDDLDGYDDDGEERER